MLEGEENEMFDYRILKLHNNLAEKENTVNSFFSS